MSAVDKMNENKENKSLVPVSLNNTEAGKFDKFEMKDISKADPNICCICCKNIVIFAVGLCDHPICFECATRMRVICKERACPVCRCELLKVIFTKVKMPFQQLAADRSESISYYREYAITFYGAAVRAECFRLLEHRCPICKNFVFRSFYSLEGHLNKIHKLYFCNICTENLKQFTFERTCYTKELLKQHFKTGDEDNASLRGHPICKFCRERFLDKDELFKHMRRKHFYCHFCEESNEFYPNYIQLAKHFRKQHFLCEVGECANCKFVNAFKNELDYKIHKSLKHGEADGASCSRDAQKLVLENLFEPLHHGSRRNRNRNRNCNLSSETACQPTTSKRSNNRSINIESNVEFPLLNPSTASTSIPNVQKKQPVRKVVEAFPVLGTNFRARDIKTADFIPQMPSQSSTPPTSHNSAIGFPYISATQQRNGNVNSEFSRATSSGASQVNDIREENQHTRKERIAALKNSLPRRPSDIQMK